MTHITPEAKQESDTPIADAYRTAAMFTTANDWLFRIADLERQLAAVTAERDAAPEKESERWAERFNFLHTEYGADCSGTDSGDLLDLVEAEVWQALRKVEAERDAKDAALTSCYVNLEAALAERNALRVDAERYRWLRQKVCMIQTASYGCKFEIINLPVHWGDAEADAMPPFDAAIDAARAK